MKEWEIRIQTNEAGEPASSLSIHGEQIACQIGSGQDLRAMEKVGKMGDGDIWIGRGASAAAMEKLKKEVEDVGGRVVKMGADSPEQADRVISGWSRKYADNFDRAFGRNSNN